MIMKKMIIKDLVLELSTLNKSIMPSMQIPMKTKRIIKVVDQLQLKTSNPSQLLLIQEEVMLLLVIYLFTNLLRRLNSYWVQSLTLRVTFVCGHSLLLIHNWLRSFLRTLLKAA